LNRALGIIMLVLYCVFLGVACWMVVQEPEQTNSKGETC